MLRAVNALENFQRVVIELLCFGELVLGIEQRCESGDVRRRLRVVWAQRLLADLDRLASVGLAAREAPARVFQAPEVVINRRYEDMIGAKTLLHDLQSAAIERPGFRKAALVFVKHSQIV